MEDFGKMSEQQFQDRSERIMSAIDKSIKKKVNNDYGEV
jgi:metal-responsive CopG/Arc/MetJ family transcriptional regulator